MPQLHFSTHARREDMAQRTLVRKQQRVRQKQARWQRFKALRKSFADACVTSDESDVTGDASRLLSVCVRVFVCLSLITKTGGKCRLAWGPNRAVPLPTGAREPTRARIYRQITLTAVAAERRLWRWGIIPRTAPQVQHRHRRRLRRQPQTIRAPGRVPPVARAHDRSRALIYRARERTVLRSPVTAHRRRTAGSESGQPALRDSWSDLYLLTCRLISSQVRFWVVKILVHLSNNQFQW